VGPVAGLSRASSSGEFTDDEDNRVSESLRAATLRDIPEYRRRMAEVVGGLSLGVFGWCLTVTAVLRIREDQSVRLMVLLFGSAVGAGLLTAISLYCIWSWRVRAQISRLESLNPGGNAWKALSYPEGQRSLERLAGYQGLFFDRPLPRSNLYALFSDESLTLWSRRGARLELVAKVPRAAAHYGGRDWRRPIFTILLTSGPVQSLPFSLGLTKGRFRHGVADADEAFATVVEWSRG
jgi:hypothetical protein